MKRLKYFAGAWVMVLAVGVFAQAMDPSALIQEGDAAYARRAEGQKEGRGIEEAIEPAIRAYRRAVELAPENLEARWKLARALNFQGVYVEQDKKRKQQILTESKDIGVKSREIIEAQKTKTQEIPHAAEIFLTLALSWGEWGLVNGKMAAAKKGVAGKIKELAELVIAVDPELEEAGGYRLLGRLHHECPKVPFVTGWASKKEALKNLGSAYKIAPQHIFNKQFYAETLYETNTDRPKALSLLDEVANAQPDSAHLLEDMRAIRDAKDYLNKAKN